MFGRLRGWIGTLPVWAQVIAWPLYGALHAAAWISMLFVDGIKGGVKQEIRNTRSQFSIKKKKK